MKKLLLPFILIFGLALSVQAQQHDWCGSDEVLVNRLQNDAEFARKFEQANQLLKQPLSETQNKQQQAVVTIPVVFHIVYASDGDNISMEQIKDGLRVLNEDYRRQNADTTNTRGIFKGVAADIEIEFKLARKDPQGNCTDGVTRTQSSESLIGDDDVKDIINWDNTKYYNIWITRNVRETTRNTPGGWILGYSSFPQPGGQSYRDDGTVMRHDELGTIGTAVSDGRTLTHETGHYLALLHPFEDFAGGSVGGCFRGDQVGDTPPVAVRNFGCNQGINSCNNDSPDLPDQIENYMDYANCVNMFTQGQKARMRNTINLANLRANLVSSANLSATGITNPPPCAPEARLTASRRIVCTDEDIQLSDLSEGGDATSWKWTLPGATNYVETQQNPIVNYPNPGVFDIILESSNAEGSDVDTLEDYIYVKAGTQPFFDRLWTESFELAEVPFPISILDYDNNAFEVFTNAGSHKDQSLRLDSRTRYIGELDEIVSPALATDNGVDLTLYFDYAFAAKQFSNSDRLTIYASRDCGETWILRRFYSGASLRTAPNTSGNFVPNNNQWLTEILSFSAYVQAEPILIKFVYENGGGNNFYIDNIRFGEGIGVGLNEDDLNSHISFFPNPSNGKINLQIQNSKDEAVELTVMDVSGRPVYKQDLTLQQGALEKQFELNAVPGLYLLKVQGETTDFTERLILK